VRFLGYVWATPTTLAGFFFFILPAWFLRQIHPVRWRDGVWEWEVVRHSWIWRRYSMRGWSATTLGYVVFYSPGQQDVRRVALHERRHVWQALWLGPFFFPVYGLIWLLTGYRDHPMERDAFAWEFRAGKGHGPQR
jgi:hypothetical protein